MTTVAYTIGSEYTTSYSKALELRDKLGLPMVKHYIPIPETPELDERAKVLRDKRVQARKERMGWA